jgi:hypothetical protein
MRDQNADPQKQPASERSPSFCGRSIRLRKLLSIMKNGTHFNVPLSSDWLKRSCRGAEAVSMDQPDLYEAVSCPACGRLHFINKITARLLGDREK